MDACGLYQKSTASSRPHQLHDFVAREKKKTGGAGTRRGTLTVGELKKSISPFEVADLMGWEDLPVHQLIVVPGAVVDAERVCIAFTCPGMIARAHGAANLGIRLAVDGKQKILAMNLQLSHFRFWCPVKLQHTHTPKLRPKAEILASRYTLKSRFCRH